MCIIIIIIIIIILIIKVSPKCMGVRWGIPYSRKYWRELNLAVEPKIDIERILADLNLVIRYGIDIRIYASRKFWRILIWRL